MAAAAVVVGARTSRVGPAAFDATVTRLSPRASRDRYAPEVPVTPGITHVARAPGDIITVKPGVCPTPYRARSTVYYT